MKEALTKTISLCLVAGVCASCAQPRSVVSSHSAYGSPYISKQILAEKEYVSALMEAQLEETRQQPSPLVQADPMPKVAAAVSPRMVPTVQTLSPLWGKPPGAVGEGITLMNPETRKRLNDALSTTPVDGEARFRYGSRQFIFMPNSEVYQPYRTGGRCRDAIVIHYDEQGEEQLRGLFCQQGRGADWLLTR